MRQQAGEEPGNEARTLAVITVVCVELKVQHVTDTLSGFPSSAARAAPRTQPCPALHHCSWPIGQNSRTQWCSLVPRPKQPQ